MAIPRQVQKQLKEVEALEKALQAQIDPSGAEDSDKKEEKATKVKPDTEILEPTEAELVTESVKVKPADTSPTGVEDDFKQKYNTLRGKYDAEVPRLHQQVKQLSDELGSIRKEITAKKDEPTKPKEKVSLVTDADREEFGEDLLNVQRKVAQEVSQEYEGRFERQEKIIQDLQDKVAGTDIAQVDNDERWVAWLNEHDPMLRAPRRVQAQTAFDSGDAEAIADYIKLWKSTLTETANESEKPIRQIEFEKQVAPNRSATSVKTPTNQSGKYYSARDMDSAWVKVRTLNTRGKYDDAAKLEAELTAAYMENRVRA